MKYGHQKRDKGDFSCTMMQDGMTKLTLTSSWLAVNALYKKLNFLPILFLGRRSKSSSIMLLELHRLRDTSASHYSSSGNKVNKNDNALKCKSRTDTTVAITFQKTQTS
jgi:hypothetical protein